MINAAFPLSRSAVPWTCRAWLLTWLLLASLGQTWAQALPPVPGDLDDDGFVTVLDLVKVISEARQPHSLSTILASRADVNDDGVVDDRDADRLVAAILGFPISPSAVPVSFEPAAGAGEVGVTVRPKVSFPKAVNVATLNSNNFYATQGGRRLPTTIRPSDSGSFAWLFLDAPMPNAATIKVVVDGSSILTIRGLPLDANGDGVPGGVARSRFSTVSLTPLPGTVLHGRVVDPGPDLRPRTADDVVLANGYQYLRPIAGVKVFLHGLEDQAVFTDSNGWYHLEPVPVGIVKVVTDGRTATTPHEGFFWPEMVSNARLEPGITNYLMYIRETNGVIIPGPNGFPMPVPVLYLPRVMSNVLQTVSMDAITIITLAGNAAYDLPPAQRPFLTLEVPPGSLIGENGQPLATGTVGISVVPPELVREMLPPGLLQHTFDISIQAPGVATFSTPVPMTFPNVFNAPPGTKLNFLSFDHNTGKLVIEGTATVSDDELTVRTDPGFGITHPGWHGLTPPGRRHTTDKPRRPRSSKGGGSGGGGGGGGGSWGGGGGGSGGGGGGGGGVGVLPIRPRPVNPFPPGRRVGGPLGTGVPGSGPSSEFDIKLKFAKQNYDGSIRLGPFSDDEKKPIRAAAKRWEKIIIGDLPRAKVGGFLWWGRTTVDDILIEVYKKRIDGPSKRLAEARPDKVRCSGVQLFGRCGFGSWGLPITGKAWFDVPDLGHPLLEEVATHEFGHALGFHDWLWDKKDLLVGKGTSNPRFTGGRAVREYRALFGFQSASVPVGSGNSHWPENLFGEELMTSCACTANHSPLSRITTAAMRDIGYKVNMAASDPYLRRVPLFVPAGEHDGEPVVLADVEPPEFDDPVEVLGLRIDFGTAGSPVEDSHTNVTATTLYTPERGHGWLPNPPGGLRDVDRGQIDPDGDDALIRDCVFTTDATFRVDVPTNGLYDVKVVAGDLLSAFTDMQIYADGELRGSVSTLMGGFATNVFRVTVSASSLDLRFAGAGGFAICGLEVNPTVEGDASDDRPSEMSGRFHVLIEDLATGFLMRSAVTLNPGQALCPEGVFLPANTHFREWAYHVDSGDVGVSEFISGPSGGESLLPVVMFGPQEKPEEDPDFETDESTTNVDTDGDGLTDTVEWIIGTRPDLADSDEDGFSDSIEIQQAQNPLSGSTASAVTGVIGALPMPGTANEIVIWNGGLTGGQTLTAMALGSAGLAVVDVTRPSNPVIVGQLALAGDALDVAVDPVLATAVVAAQSGGLHVVDVSDPGQPRLLRSLRLPARQVEIIAGVAYVAVGSQLWAVDLGSLEFLQQLPLGGAAITGLGCEGQFLYTMDANRVLRVIDISGGDLRLRGSITLTHGGGRIFVGGSVAYVAGSVGVGGFATVNVANPAAPLLISGPDSASIQGVAVAANGSGLAVAVGSVIAPSPGLDLLNVSDPSNTAAFLARFALPGSPRAVTLAGGIAYVACGEAGLRVVNYLSLDFQRMAPAIALRTDFARTSLTNGHIEGGQLTRVAAQVTDDQQVRSVEFYVDGALAINDLTFPFEYRFLAPTLSLLKTNFTLRARALDTGGNATWSDEILVELDPDFSGPVVRRVTPAPNAIVGTTDRVTAWFNEPLDAASLTAGTFQLFSYGSNGPITPLFAVAVTNVSLFYRADVSAAFLIASSNLAAGLYEARLLPPLTDRSSNALGAPVSWFFRVLDRPDRDLDGVPDDVEAALGTDPDSPDSNGNGVLDGDEDSDGDGLSNRWEIAFGLDPTRADTDGNGVNDGEEDPDQDSLSNRREQLAGTLPLNPDTDGDGWSDEAEVTGGSNPLVAASTPRLYIVGFPPVSLAIPVLREPTGSGALNYGAVVANPPVSAAIPVVPSYDPLAGLTFGTVVAHPPAALAIPVVPPLAVTDLTSFGTIIAAPPASLAIPAVPSATLGGFTNFGAVIARPPVQIQINTNTP